MNAPLQQPIVPPSPTGGIGHNRPPLEEEVVIDFLEAAKDRDGVNLLARLEEIAALESKLGQCDTEQQARAYTDFIKQAKEAVNALEALRQVHNAPILAAGRALKGKSDGLAARVAEAERKARNALDGYMAAERRRQDEQRREAEAAARRASEEAARVAQEQADAGMDIDVAPVVRVEAAKVKPATVVGDLGAKAVSTTVYDFKISSVRQLPDSILKHAKVVEAIEKVIGAQVRGGVREMKGVEIFPVQRTTIR